MLKEKFPDYGILIFSQGKLEDFKDIIDVTGEESFRLNRSIQETFHSLVEAKIFISAKSNFSYAAAILNKNTVYYDPGYWYKPLDHWIKLEV